MGAWTQSELATLRARGSTMLQLEVSTHHLCRLRWPPAMARSLLRRDRWQAKVLTEPLERGAGLCRGNSGADGCVRLGYGHPQACAALPPYPTERAHLHLGYELGRPTHTAEMLCNGDRQHQQMQGAS